MIHIPKVHSRFAWTVLAQVLAAMSEIDVNRKDSADGLSADDRKKLELRKALAQRSARLLLRWLRCSRHQGARDALSLPL